MKFLPLVWAMLWRRRARTVLTFASIAAAFLLYGVLQAVGDVLGGGARFASADALIVTNRYGFAKPLPYAYRERIAAVPGVAVVQPMVFLPVVYEDSQRGSQPTMAVDPKTFSADSRFVVAPAVQRAWEETRDGMVVGRQLAEKYGWKVGDHLPLKIAYLRRKDGAQYWDFHIVGLFDYNEEIMGKGLSAMRSFARYDYVDELRVDPGSVNIYLLRVRDPQQAPDIAHAVDAMFENSGHPTRTQSEAEQQRAMLAQVGDVGAIVRAILSAVFFTLVVVAGNTMMRAFRERIPELAVLKTLGYTDRAVAVLVVLESILLCVGGGLAGLLLAWLLLKPLAHAVASVLPLLRMNDATLYAGAAFAAALGLVSAVVPAWQSARLTVIAGLSRR